MFVYRIARSGRIADLSGTGARLFGGRWNQKGVPAVYTSESRSLATVEFLVHVPIAMAPAQFSLAVIAIPDGLPHERVPPSRLPKNWRSFPAPTELANMGSAWVRQGKSLLLRVPSAVVEGEFNMLINPNHPDMARVRVAAIEKYRFDPRLFRKGRGK